MNPRLAARPLDTKRRVPVPFAQALFEDGSADFAAIDAGRSMQCARERLCGLCGQELTYWVAFIGGPRSVESRAFTDPPMHVECAEDAFTLCPHLRRPLVTRREATPGTSVPQGWSENKPERWALFVTRSFAVQYPRLAGGGYGVQYTAAPAKTVRWFEYGDKEIREVTA